MEQSKYDCFWAVVAAGVMVVVVWAVKRLEYRLQRIEDRMRGYK